jgi:hypothetical protein
MEHLEFVDKLNKSGINISSTITENKAKVVKVDNGFDENEIEIKNFECKYTKESAFSTYTALQSVIKKAIDMGSWKHSWHNEITPENYEKFKEIIQEKILNKAEEIGFLLTVYFQINHEITKEQ